MSDGIGLKNFNPIAYLKTWRRVDWIALVALVVLVIVLALPDYLPKNGCEVARAAYKCLPAKTVMVENCDMWGNFSCDSTADTSLPQVEWYIDNLCTIHNRLHPDDQLSCGNLRTACNQATGQQVCPVA